MKPGSDELVSTRQMSHSHSQQHSQQLAAYAIPPRTAAIYDTTTEGKSGWRFVLTRRWLAFAIGAVVYLARCSIGVFCQWQLGQQITQFNTTVSQNFDAAAVPLNQVLPSLERR